MSTALSDARQKLFDLRKKYSSISLKKYEKKSLSSNESLIDLSDVSLSNEVKDNTAIKFSAQSSLKSDSSGKNNNYSLQSEHLSTEEHFVKISSNESVSRGYNSKINDFKSVTKLSLHSDILSNGSSRKFSSDRNDIEEQKIDEDSSGSNHSIYKSQDIEEDNQSEIEEVLLDEDIESSINDPFANIHLVSDDILEDLDSSIGSHSSIKDDGHTGRLSAVQSVKSLQLSSPLEPPRQDYDYESDFESSDSENESIKSDSEVKHNNKENIPDGFITNNTIIQDEIDMGKDVTSDTTSKSYSSDKKNFNKNPSVDNTKLSINNIETKSSVYNSVTSDIKIKSKTILSSHTSSTKSNESIPEEFEDDKSTKTASHHSGSEESKTSSKLSEVTSSDSFKKLTLRNKKSGAKLSTPKIKKNKIALTCKTRKNDVGINVNLSNSEFHKNVLVQTSERLTFSNNKYEDIRSNVKSALREKWYINTNVKSSKHRPIVKSSKLFRSSSEKIDYNPFLFTVEDGLPIDKLLNEMLRNQITMTKYFIDCHHQLYLQCCKTVKSLNKDYKKSQTQFFI